MAQLPTSQTGTTALGLLAAAGAASATDMAAAQTELADHDSRVSTLEGATRIKHGDIGQAATLKTGNTAPTFVTVGPLGFLSFDMTDFAYRVYRLDTDFLDTPAMHIHWTKDSNSNVGGQTCKWQVNYTVYTSNGTEITAGTKTINTGDLTYTDTGTTTRYIYRSGDMALDLSGVVNPKYVAVSVQRIASGGSQLTAAGLVSLDLTYRAKINAAP